MNASLAMLIVDILSALGHVIIEAFKKGDSATLKRVTDFLPKGHVLKSRIQYELQDALAREQFGVDDDEDTEK